MKEEIKVTLNKNKAVFVNNLIRIMVSTIDLYNKLKNSFNLLINDLNLISKKLVFYLKNYQYKQMILNKVKNEKKLLRFE